MANMDAELAEVVPFLEDSRAEAREMAAEGIAGYTATPEGTAALCRCEGLYRRLVSLMARAGEKGCGLAAAHAAAAAVNLSQQPAERVHIVNAGAAEAATCIESVAVKEPPELASCWSTVYAVPQLRTREHTSKIAWR